MNVAHARRDAESTRAEHRSDAHVFRTVRNNHDSTRGEWLGQRGIDEDLGRGLFPESGMTWAGLHVGVAVCARAVLPDSITATTDNTGTRLPATCFSVIMFCLPLIKGAFDRPDHTENGARNLLDHGVGTDHAPTNTIVQ